MRIVNGVLCLILLTFVAVQYNDPDPWRWGGIYGVAAIFAGLAAFRPALFTSGRVAVIYVVCLLASLVGVYHYWPNTPEWWAPKVWADAAVMSDGTEIAREGMGMMIVALAMLYVGLTVRRQRG
jgi:hypothetical protein